MVWYSTYPANFPPGGGIYQWWIGGAAVYTGQAIDLRRRLRQYERNIERLDHGEPYRLSNPDGFREIHRRLLNAIENGMHIEFRVIEYCEESVLNDRERFHQAQMPIRDQPGVANFQTLQKATDEIVHSVMRDENPPEEAINLWLRGGAAFWDQEHYVVAWGLFLAEALDIENVEQMGIKAAIAACDDDIARLKFGSIPLRSFQGPSVVAISGHSGFTGDQLHGFFRDEEAFRVDAQSKGWLLGEDRYLSDAVSMQSVEQLMRVFASGQK